jgi:Arc/MetJ-type ribon-helix-helix transcriptional regulator
MSKTERLAVDLPAHLLAGLRESVRSGEVLLRTWYGEAGTKEPDLEALRAFVAEGLADVDAGRSADAEEVYGRVLARIDELVTAKAR